MHMEGQCTHYTCEQEVSTHTSQTIFYAIDIYHLTIMAPTLQI